MTASPPMSRPWKLCSRWTSLPVRFLSAWELPGSRRKSSGNLCFSYLILPAIINGRSWSTIPSTPAAGTLKESPVIRGSRPLKLTEQGESVAIKFWKIPSTSGMCGYLTTLNKMENGSLFSTRRKPLSPRANRSRSSRRSGIGSGWTPSAGSGFAASITTASIPSGHGSTMGATLPSPA